MFNAGEKTGLHIALYSGVRTGYATRARPGEAGWGAATTWNCIRNTMLRKITH